MFCGPFYLGEKGRGRVINFYGAQIQDDRSIHNTVNYSFGNFKNYPSDDKKTSCKHEQENILSSAKIFEGRHYRTGRESSGADQKRPLLPLLFLSTITYSPYTRVDQVMYYKRPAWKERTEDNATETRRVLGGGVTSLVRNRPYYSIFSGSYPGNRTLASTTKSRKTY